MQGTGAIVPSMFMTTSATVISEAGRERTYPPCGPLSPLTISALESMVTICSRYLMEMSWRAEMSLIFTFPDSWKAAISTNMRNAYLVLVDTFTTIRITFFVY